MAIALLTPYLADYRVPLFKRLADRHGVEVLCYGAGERYVPSWFANLDLQLAKAPFPARRLRGPAAAFAVARTYDAVITGYAGGSILPAAYAGARLHRRPFVMWASVWAQPRSVTHLLAQPLTQHIYRDADAVVAYGEHVLRFVAEIRGSGRGIYVAPQAVEPELFARPLPHAATQAFRVRHRLGDRPVVAYVGRLVEEKGVAVLLDAWPHVTADATLAVVGDGPLAKRAAGTPRVRLIGPLRRPEIPAAYGVSELTVLPSIPTRRFLEPWGLVCNESMLQSRPVVVTTAVGAAAGGLVRDGETGLVVAPNDAKALARAIDRLLHDPQLRGALGASAHKAASAYTYDAMAAGFDQALEEAFKQGRLRATGSRARSGRRRRVR